MHFEPILKDSVKEDDDHTSDVAVDDDDDGDDDDDDDDNDDDNGPVELFQKRGKWWELIVCLPFPVMGGLCHCFTRINHNNGLIVGYNIVITHYGSI